jgi:hypothetical protein
MKGVWRVCDTPSCVSASATTTDAFALTARNEQMPTRISLIAGKLEFSMLSCTRQRHADEHDTGKRRTDQPQQ